MSPRKRKNQGVQVPTGVPYGQGQQLAEAQRAIPLPGPASTPQPHASRPSTTTAQSTTPAPTIARDPMEAALAAALAMEPPVGGLARPSQRPNEPVTAGLAIGPGPGPEVLPLPVFPNDDEAVGRLILAHRQHPTPELARLIEVARRRANVNFAGLDAARRRQAQLERGIGPRQPL